MVKFNKSSREHVVFCVREILDSSRPILQTGILVILECLSVNGVISKKDCQIYFNEDSMADVESLAIEFGYTISGSDGEVVVKKKQSEIKRFVPPTYEEVRDYMIKIEILDPDKTAERFIAYYTSNGWMVGKIKMKDWKSACVTWKTRQSERTSSVPPGMVRVFPRGSQKTIVISKEDYERSVKSGTNYYKLTQ